MVSLTPAPAPQGGSGVGVVVVDGSDLIFSAPCLSLWGHPHTSTLTMQGHGAWMLETRNSAQATSRTPFPYTAPLWTDEIPTAACGGRHVCWVLPLICRGVCVHPSSLPGRSVCLRLRDCGRPWSGHCSRNEADVGVGSSQTVCVSWWGGSGLLGAEGTI